MGAGDLSLQFFSFRFFCVCSSALEWLMLLHDVAMLLCIKLYICTRAPHGWRCLFLHF